MSHTKGSDKLLRDITIKLRATLSQRSLIDKAAAALGKNRSDFMLETACREAESVLLDQRYFSLDEKAFKKFRQELDKPPGKNIRLRRMLSAKADV